MTATDSGLRPGAGAGAPPRPDVDWHQTDWVQVHTEVRRLQARIVKATQEGRHGKVKALQHLLTHSYSGRMLAVKRVTENRGKRTAGVDGATWSTPAAKSGAVDTLTRRGYRSQPLRRVLIPKSNGKTRPLGIPTMTDRAMQALYKLALEPVAETTADPHSYGFRPLRSTHDALQQVHNILAANRNCARWVLEGDIKGCFDNIDHEWLLAHVPMDRSILRQWLKAGFIESNTLHATGAGTPQGGIISPVLANLALDGLEEYLRVRVTPTQKLRYARKVNVVRYADDFIVTGDSRELLQDTVMPLVAEFLAARGLALSPEKTRVTHVEEGFDFLGQHARRYGEKTLITPAAKNVRAMLEKVREVVRQNRQATQLDLIGVLNPIIRGWAQYHRSACSKRTYSRVDALIWQMLWQWATRRHPTKGARWVRARYFHRNGSRTWVFGAATGRRYQNGKPIMVNLFRAADTPIRRHVLIRSDANPFDPAWANYVETRIRVQTRDDLAGRRMVRTIWENQSGRCPVCLQPITLDSGWHKHHRIYRVDGGTDDTRNLVLLHQNCHAQTHVLGATVA